MKRLLIGVLFLTMLFPSLILTHSADAATQVAASTAVNVLQNPNGPCNNPDATNKPAICGDDDTNGPNPLFGSSGIVTVVVMIISYVIGFLAIVFLIVQAIKLAGSGGDPQTVSSARSGILYALIGLVVAVLARVLVTFVLTKIT
jgi:hypothetical protein